jgi:hypothetical protein
MRMSVCPSSDSTTVTDNDWPVFVNLCIDIMLLTNAVSRHLFLTLFDRLCQYNWHSNLRYGSNAGDWRENSQSYFHTLQALDVSPTCDAADVKLKIQLFPHSSQHVTGNGSHSLSDAPLQIIDIRTLRDFLSIRTQDSSFCKINFWKYILLFWITLYFDSRIYLMNYLTALSVSLTIQSRMIRYKMKHEQEFNLRHYPSICLRVLRKTTKYLCQDTRSSGRHLNRDRLEYEAGVLTTRPRRFCHICVATCFNHVLVRMVLKN